MNADQLLAHYERIGDAPDAIARLRRFILDLAVRGNLVEQDPNDEPASKLLKRIASGEGAVGEDGEDQETKDNSNSSWTRHAMPIACQLAVEPNRRNRRVKSSKRCRR